MSFSAEVKNELARVFPPSKEEQCAELSAIIQMSSSLSLNKSTSLQIVTENPAIARKSFILLKNLFFIRSQVHIRQNHSFKRKTYLLSIVSPAETQRILRGVGILEDSRAPSCYSKKPPAFLKGSDPLKRAYLRGAFLGSGSISHPEKLYHMEFVTGDKEMSQHLKKLLNSFGFGAKIVERKSSQVIYIKDSECISDLLAFIGAHQALLRLENVKIQKEMKNNVNRIVNCETANLNKTVDAAIRQVEAIEYIRSVKSLDVLPTALRELAALRLENPDLSLKELGERMKIPLGKSGVNHRLKRIEMIAKQIREGIF